MAGEYAVMGIYPKGHVMEFVRPTLSPDVLPARDIDTLPEGEKVLVAGWPVARQHPRGMEGTVFVTIEDETGDVQLIVWPQGLCPVQEGAGKPRSVGQGRRLPARWHYQCDPVQREDPGCRDPDARRPRLALRWRV